MTRNRWFAVAGGVALVALGVFVGRWALKPAPQVEHRDVPVLDGNLIRFSPGFAERAGVKSTPVAEQELSPLIEVSGVFQFDPKHDTWVGARISGRVRNVYKYEGDLVKEGEVLAELESAELGRAQADVIKMRAKEAAANAQEAREQRLSEAKISSQRDAEIARAEAEATRAERLAAEQAVKALGGEVDAKEVGILRLRAPIAGRVTSPPLHRGQMVDPTTNAFRIADISHLWVELALFEQDIQAVREDDEVEIFLGSMDKANLKGRIAHVGRVIDEDTRSAKVRVEVENPDGTLRPGQGLRARIHASGPKARWVAIPTEAISRIDGKPTVFVLTEDTAAEIRSVKVGPKSGTHTAVLAGLSPGERIVSEGVFALKSEIFR